jgi:signal transduction histidine kinase
VRKLSQRLSAAAPSITVGLILFSVLLTALLGYRAFEASRAQRELAENTLRDYAGFGAFQLKYTASSRIAGQHRLIFDPFVGNNDRRFPAPPLGAKRAGEIIAARGPLCRCLDSTAFHYQVRFANRTLETTPSPLLTPTDLDRLRDTIIADALELHRVKADDPNIARGLPPPRAPFFDIVVTPLGGRLFAFVHVFITDVSNQPTLAYGYAMPAEVFVGRMVRNVIFTQPILPGTLTRGMRVDSIISATAYDLQGQVIFTTTPGASRRFAVSDTPDPRFGDVRMEVAINPEAAGRLIIGGLPRSRLPEVLATAFVSFCLLGLLLYQFRRQEELGRLRDDFVSGVSHELRTPLAQIRLLAELFRMGKVPTDEGKERSLRIIDEEARRLSFLVDSILSFTRARKQPDHLAPISTDIAAEVEEIIAGFEPLAHAQGTTITTQLQRGLVADVDRSALRQVLLNLLDNAVRYGPRGQTITVATASTPGHAGTWSLEVADAGPGVPSHERERIFDAYYRMKRDAGGAVGGTGIGLAVVRRLVAEHGGDVHVAPTTDNAKGARFVVTLPKEVPTPASVDP